MSLPALGLALAAAVSTPIVPTPTVSAPQDEPPAEEAEAGKPKWEGAVTVGINATDGNSDIQKASVTADAVKKLEKERYTLGFSWNFSEEEGVVSQRKTFGKAQYDRFVNDKLYWLAQASAESDFKAGVELRTTIGAGVGYQFKDTEKLKLSGEAGLTWFNEELKPNVENDYVAARLAYNWAYLPSESWSIEQSGQVFPSVEDSDDVYSKVDTRAKVTLTESMFAQVQWVWDWDNTPAPGNEKSDHLYLLTIGWKF